MLMDIHYNGKTLYGEYAPEINETFKKITGLLSAAEIDNCETEVSQ